ncbi:MAG: DUF6807 family protein [Marinilabilia sp.]
MKRSIFIFISFILSIPALAQQINISENEEGLQVTENGKKVFFYQKASQDHEGEYERCHYIHPLRGLEDGIITEDFPDDHLHHRGIFWAWHQVWINDQRIGDPWEIKDFDQEVVDLDVMNADDGKGRIETRVHWKSPLWEDGKEPYLKESTTITVHPESGNHRRIDFTIRLRATVDNLTIGGSENEKGYGGFSVRMVLPDDVRFSGPEGKVKPQNTPVPSPGYINIAGSLENESTNSGILIIDSPENPDYPQDWILRKKHSMQNAVFPGQDPYPVSKSDPLKLKYSLIIYSGNPAEKTIKQWIGNTSQ